MQTNYRRIPVRAMQNHVNPLHMPQHDPNQKLIVRASVSQSQKPPMDVRQNFVRRFSSDQENINPAFKIKPQEPEKQQLQQTIRWPIRMVTMNQPPVQVESAKAQVHRMSQPFGQSFVYNTIKQSTMISPKKHESMDVTDFDQCLSQKDETIRQQAEKLEKLEKEISNRDVFIQEIQRSNEQKFKAFQNEITQKLQTLEVGIEKNDNVTLFLSELERKSNNLQTHINEQIQKAEDECFRKKKEIQIMQHNLKSNLWLKLDDDENFFKQELNHIHKNLEQMVDKTKVEQQITAYVQAMQNELKHQIKQANDMVELASQTLQDGLKREIQGKLTDLQNNITERVRFMEEQIAQQGLVNQSSEQEKRLLHQTLKSLNSKFNSLTTEYNQKMAQQKQMIQQIDKEKQILSKQNQDYQRKLQQQTCLISQLEQTQLKQKELKHPLLSPIQQQSVKGETLSFCSNSTNVDVLKSQNRQMRPVSNRQKKIFKGDISLEDFADFNENSFSESCDSFEMEQTSNLKKKLKQSYESPKKNPFAQSTLNLINNQLEQHVGAIMTEEKLDEIVRAIKRSIKWMGKFNYLFTLGLLYIDPSGRKTKILRCTYSPGGHISDKELGLYLLDDKGIPYKVSKEQKEELVRQKHIMIV